MNTFIRTTLLALLTLIALAAQAMPCPMPETSVVIAGADMADAHCDRHVATDEHAGMSLGDCLTAVPALPQADAAALAPASTSPQPAAPPLLLSPPAQVASDATVAPGPPPDARLASQLWSVTQRLLL